jgi:hypothetical protein
MVNTLTSSSGFTTRSARGVRDVVHHRTILGGINRIGIDFDSEGDGFFPRRRGIWRTTGFAFTSPTRVILFESRIQDFETMVVDAKVVTHPPTLVGGAPGTGETRGLAVFASRTRSIDEARLTLFDAYIARL